MAQLTSEEFEPVFPTTVNTIEVSFSEVMAVVSGVADVVDEDGESLVENNIAILPHIPDAVSDLENDLGYITEAEIPTKTSDLENDSGFITSAAIPVLSVNGKTGTIVLSYSDIGADAAGAAALVQTNLNTLSTQVASHISNYNNPHNLTKEQIGLGNVPNVTTANQTPGYDTTITTLTNLSESDTLYRICGKLYKSIDVLSNHLSAVNPHNITLSYLGGAPLYHASDATTYGVGNNSIYGHVKLSDSYISSSDVNSGYAATPKAVSQAVQLIQDKFSIYGGTIYGNLVLSGSLQIPYYKSSTGQFLMINSTGYIYTSTVGITNFETDASKFQMDGTASTGSSNKYCHSDHIHPTDTTRASTSALDATNTRVSTIESYIPTNASASNQLADKDFVNSSIANIAARQITNNAFGNAFETYAKLLEGPYFYQGIVVVTLKNNDFGTVLNDEHKNIASVYASFTTTTQYVGYYVNYLNVLTLVTSSNKDSLDITPGATIAYYSGAHPTTRYRYDGTQWTFDHIINNSPLTQAQLDTLNSTVTLAWKTDIDNNRASWVHEQANWAETNSAAKGYIQNKPTIGNGLLSISYNGTTLGNFNANQTTTTNINIVPNIAYEVVNT